MPVVHVHQVAQALAKVYVGGECNRFAFFPHSHLDTPLKHAAEQLVGQVVSEISASLQTLIISTCNGSRIRTKLAGGGFLSVIPSTDRRPLLRFDFVGLPSLYVYQTLGRRTGLLSQGRGIEIELDISGEKTAGTGDIFPFVPSQLSPRIDVTMDRTGVDPVTALQAYHYARLHPLQELWSPSLEERLFESLNRATEEIAALASRSAFPDYSGFIAYRIGGSCPTCGGPVRTSILSLALVPYCPNCQPEGGAQV